MRFATRGSLKSGALWLLIVLFYATAKTRAQSPNELPGLQQQLENYSAAGRWREAEPVAQRILAITERFYPNDAQQMGGALNGLAIVFRQQGKYPDAEKLLKRALTMDEQANGPVHKNVGQDLTNLGNVYLMQGRLAEAEPLYRRAMTISEQLSGPMSEETARMLNNLAMLEDQLARYDLAERDYKRALAIWERILGPEHRNVAHTLSDLATVAMHRDRFSEAEQLYKRALALREKTLGRDHPDVAETLMNLGLVYQDQTRFPEAESSVRKALTIWEKVNGAEHYTIVNGLNSLANVFYAQGRYAEAEPLYKRSLALGDKLLGPDNPYAALNLINLANVYDEQSRFAEAEPLHRRGLALLEKMLGHEHPEVARSLNNLANVLSDEGKLDEAERLHRRALSICEKVFGPEHPQVAASLLNVANVELHRGRFVESEALFRRALAISEKTLIPTHPQTITALNNLAAVLVFAGKTDEANALLDRSISLAEKGGASHALLFKCYDQRSQLAWQAKDRERALADLHRAMVLAEQQRARSSGAEQEQAKVFGEFARAFERMVAWQTELGDLEEAFSAIERTKARSLIEQQELRGINLLAGLPASEAEALRRRETEARALVNNLEKRLSQLDERRELSPAQRKQEIEAIAADLAKARQQALDAYRDVRNASPAYRLAVGQDRKPVTLQTAQERLTKDNGLLLEYLLGDEQGFVVIIPPGSDKPRLEKLTLSDQSARILGVDPGPLTAQRLKTLLENAQNTGLLQRLSNPNQASQALEQLAALWNILIPEPERSTLTKGNLKALQVVPDGPLSQLPFETLVVEESGGGEPTYLLEVGPPIVYAPSATVLFNLANRGQTEPLSDREPVLSVGNPAYPGTEGDDNGMLGSLAMRSLYRGTGARLSRLPYTAWEIEWVSKGFTSRGIKAATLSGAVATEAGVRYWGQGRRVLHLACHGLVDQTYGNFFGALALTPGPRGTATPSDDGFLTLPEIYELNLKDCELAILSSCQTNYGPQQKGEGVWALSRGFLVAGARRVVASNWLVDDEAAASLVSVFCSGLAQAEKANKPIDHAAALQAAKRWVRQQERWRSPYYWAGLALIGPP